jgi:putative SOS response-associated peptidase YedK
VGLHPWACTRGPAPAGTVAGMCGRYASTRSAADLAALFELDDETGSDLVPDYNIAPTDPAAIVRLSSRSERPVLTLARWGLVPAWARDASGGARMINARSETVAESRAFGRAFAQRRCLVPADGWYEWRRIGGKAKQPYFMTRPESLMFAGIWSTWKQPNAEDAARVRLFTFSILTLPAQDDLKLVHDRMPLVLEPSRWSSWLSGTGLPPAGLLAAPSPRYCAGIELRPVSAAVGDVHNDGAGLVQAVVVPPLSASTIEEPQTLF